MPMTELSTQRLLTFAKRLQHAATFAHLIDLARAEAEAATGYGHVWFMVADDDSCDELRLLEVSGAQSALAWEVSPRLKVTGDAFLEALIASDGPVVIEDARTDARTNKALVEQLQNRTLINIPLYLLDKPFGLFGLGTFGDEGCRAPTPAQLEYLVGMANQISVAAGRIRFVENHVRAEREKREFERRLLQVHKLESLGMLAGGIAHDFNNLLTVILASASLAEVRATDPAQTSDLHAVIGAATRARDLTRQLLAMSRTQDLTLRPLDLNGQLAQLVELLRRVLPATIQLEHIQGLHLPLIEGDASQLDQVFMNIGINARDAMPDGGRLTIETEQVLINGQYTQAHPWAKQGRYVLITISDTGIGMPADVVERVFEPFFTTKGERAGTGLGLAVTYGIVRQHGGMLNCYSEVGVGTTFKVYLPVRERLATTVGPKLLGQVPTGNERILVAEDDDGVRAVILRILEQGGYHVTAVNSGDAACSLAARERFDLIILDVVMPGMPCQTAIERLRALRPDMRLLLSSGYSAGANIVALLQLTGLALLRKPYDPDQLLRHVREALDHS